jgi:hypothetical protein
MKKKVLGIFLIFILAIISLNFIGALNTCIDSNSGDGYYQAGATMGDNSTLINFCNSSNNYCDNHFSLRDNNRWISSDYCADKDYLLEAYCKGDAGEHLVTGGVLSYDRHLCEYGCEENNLGYGYCLSAPKVCANLNQTIKNKIIELQNTGQNILLIEGNSFVSEGNYVVINQESSSKILRVEKVRYNLTARWVSLTDIINNESLNFIFNKSQTENGQLLLTIDGQKYYVYSMSTLVSDSNPGSILFVWGEGANSNLLESGVGTETTVSCPRACENGICLNCSENWTCTNWSNCIDNREMRQCIDLNKCGTIIEKPTEIEGCFCAENWTCNNWEKCINKITKRNCSDSTQCGTIYNKPLTFRDCTSEDLRKGEIIETFINNTKIIFERNPNGTNTLKTNKSFVSSLLNITGESEKLYVLTSLGNKEIKILPEDAISKSGEISHLNNITLKEYNGEIVYLVSGTKETKILFIIPLTEKIQIAVNADNANVMFVERPWWHFFTFGV